MENGCRLVLNCLFLLQALAFALATLTLFPFPRTLRQEPLGSKKKNHCCYFYIWNPNLIDLRGRELQLFKRVDFVCDCAECGSCHGISMYDFCEGSAD